MVVFADSKEKITVTSQLEDSSLPDIQPGVSMEVPSSLGSHSPFPQTHSFEFPVEGGQGPSLCIAVIGATGELARRKIFPALFALYYSGFLPEVGILLYHFSIGFSRNLLSCRMFYTKYIYIYIGFFFNAFSMTQDVVYSFFTLLSLFRNANICLPGVLDEINNLLKIYNNNSLFRKIKYEYVLQLVKNAFLEFLTVLLLGCRMLVYLVIQERS